MFLEWAASVIVTGIVFPKIGIVFGFKVSCSMSRCLLENVQEITYFVAIFSDWILFWKILDSILVQVGWADLLWIHVPELLFSLLQSLCGFNKQIWVTPRHCLGHRHIALYLHNCTLVSVVVLSWFDKNIGTLLWTVICSCYSCTSFFFTGQEWWVWARRVVWSRVHSALHSCY